MTGLAWRPLSGGTSSGDASPPPLSWTRVWYLVTFSVLFQKYYASVLTFSLHKIPDVCGSSWRRCSRKRRGVCDSWGKNTQLHWLSMQLYWLIEINAHTLCFKSRSSSFTSDFISHATSRLGFNWNPCTDSLVPEVLHFIHSPQSNSRATLFMIPQFMSPDRLSPYLLQQSACVSRCAPSETMVLSINKQWVCHVLFERNRYILREGTRGCKDNGFL